MGNSNQIYITLNTGKPFDFPDRSAMQTFLKTSFTGIPPPSVFFSRKASDKQLFDCLLIFPSGVPNSLFQADFSYNYQGSTGKTQVAVDLLLVSSPRLSRKTSARQRGNEGI